MLCHTNMGNKWFKVLRIKDSKDNLTLYDHCILINQSCRSFNAGVLSLRNVSDEVLIFWFYIWFPIELFCLTLFSSWPIRITIFLLQYFFGLYGRYCGDWSFILVNILILLVMLTLGYRFCSGSSRDDSDSQGVFFHF